MKRKRLKRKLNTGIIMLLPVTVLAFALYACSDDEKRVYVYPHHTFSVGMGVVNEGNIHTDKGNILIPDESSVGHDLVDGERVFVNCSLLEREDENTYRVRINKYYPLLTKDILLSSETDDDELGDEPIEVRDAWFGGGYLNVRLGLEHNPSSNTPHLVNMVCNDVKSTSDTIFLTLRHNAFADTVRTRMGTATASFSLEDVMEGKGSEVYVRLRWQWYDRFGVIRTWEDGGSYTVSSGEEDTGASDHDTDNVNIQ